MGLKISDYTGEHLVDTGEAAHSLEGCVVSEHQTNSAQRRINRKFKINCIQMHFIEVEPFVKWIVAVLSSCSL